MSHVVSSTIKTLSSFKISTSESSKSANISLNLLRCLDINVPNLLATNPPQMKRHIGLKELLLQIETILYVLCHILVFQYLPKVTCYNFPYHKILLVFARQTLIVRQTSYCIFCHLVSVMSSVLSFSNVICTFCENKTP